MIDPGSNFECKSWKPLVEGSSPLAASCSAWLKDISSDVFEQNYQVGPNFRATYRFYEEALLFCYMASISEDPKWRSAMVDRLNSVIGAARHIRALGLYGGLCGAGWVTEHVSRFHEQLHDDPAETVHDEEEGYDPNAALDLAILRAVRSWRLDGSYDLVSGLVGIGLYCLERLPVETVVASLECIADHLYKTSQRSAEGTTWLTLPTVMPDWQGKIAPNGYYNLGTAHGIPGIIYLVAELAIRGIRSDLCWELFNQTLRWLINHQNPSGSASRFCSWFTEEATAPSRLAWCYGDLGIVGVLSHAGRITGDSTCIDFAEQLLTDTLSRPSTSSGVRDAPLCHGAMGISHVFNRLFHTVHDVRCREMAIRWLEEALNFRRPGEGVGGVLAYAQNKPNEVGQWEANPAFLGGAIGVGLALISAIYEIEPSWDRLLLISGCATAQ